MFWMQDSRGVYHKLPQTILPKLENMRLQVAHWVITFIKRRMSLRMVSSKWDPIGPCGSFVCHFWCHFSPAFSHESFSPNKLHAESVLFFFLRRKTKSKGPSIYVPWLQQDQRTYGYRWFWANRSWKFFVLPLRVPVANEDLGQDIPKMNICWC